MNCFRRPEPTLSRPCCALNFAVQSEIYRLTVKFRDESLSLQHSRDTARPARPTSICLEHMAAVTDRRQSQSKANIASAEAARTRLSLPVGSANQRTY